MGSKLKDRDAIVELLRSHGIAPTHQRMEIAQALLARPQHLSADQILMLVNQHHAESSKATIYNTLKLFLSKGLVREVIVDPSKVFYDSTVTPHHHFYNVGTGELYDIDQSEIQISGPPRLPEGTVTEGVDIIIRIRADGDTTA